jgi:hypothetical protein
MNMTALRSIAVAIALAAVTGHAQDKPCTKADAAAAEKNVDMVVGWAQLQRAWRDYRHCDTGPVSEIFTDAILRLAVEWKNVDALGEAMKDPQFKAFVVKHLKSPAAQGDHDSIYSRTKASCPASQAALCAELAEVVKRPAKAAPAEAPQPPSKAEPPKPAGK